MLIWAGCSWAATVPAAQAFTLNKAGNNGTYFQVTDQRGGYQHAFRSAQRDADESNR